MIEKIEKRLKQRMAICKEIQSMIDALAPKIEQLANHDLITYQMLNKPDALYNDSPISKFVTFNHLKRYMIKKDMEFIGHVFDGKHTVKDFTEIAAEVPNWVLRFAKDPIPDKKGIDAILGQNEKPKQDVKDLL